MNLQTKEGYFNSLQISHMGDITGASFKLQQYFLVKNNTDDDLEVKIVLAGQKEPITTTLYVGWNPELIKEVINAPQGLQYGY